MNSMFVCALYIWCVCGAGGCSLNPMQTCYTRSHVKSINDRTTAPLAAHCDADAVTMRPWNWNIEIMKSSESSPTSVLIYSHAFSAGIFALRHFVCEGDTNGIVEFVAKGR